MMHVLVTILTIGVAFGLLAGSLIQFSTSRNRIALFIMAFAFPVLIAIAVSRTLFDLLTGKRVPATGKPRIDFNSPEMKQAAANIAQKRIEMFGGQARTRILANEIRERYCIHLTRSTQTVADFFDHRHKMAA